MKSNLIISDAKKFLDKYTRFMTKDVYIGRNMNQKFLDGYIYLKDELVKNKYLYQDSFEYKNLFRYYNHNSEILRLHNQKYLKKALKEKEEFFDSLYAKDILDKSKRLMILSEEDEMLVVNKKNNIPFIVSKISYLNKCCDIDLDKVLVLVYDVKDFGLLDKELNDKKLGVSRYVLDDYRKTFLKNGESILSHSVLYDKLFNYITVDIFSDKKRFCKFYELFYNYIYLNRDYKDFDTFRDYHFYMYKRMFIESGLSLKKYNEKEIRKRRVQLRSICNDFMLSGEMVDVANFLYLNSIDYTYDKDRDLFVCKSKNHKNIIMFGEGKIGDNFIILDKDGKYLEILAYELIKRQYPMERRSDDDIYQLLLNSTVDSYFCDFINNILIPCILYYHENGCFVKNSFSKEQVLELKNIYDYFIEFTKNELIINDKELNLRIRNGINKSKYEYVILFGDINLDIKKKKLVIWNDYKRINIINDNVKLLYDYKSYLSDNKELLISNVYLNEGELTELTNRFLKGNLRYLNEKISDSKNSICVCFYEEENKLRYLYNLSRKIYDIVGSEKKKGIAFAFESKRDMNLLTRGDLFYKDSYNVLKCDYGVIDCYNVLDILKKYQVVILPNLIRDSYHSLLLDSDDYYRVKVGLFMALSKCTERVYLLCPNSMRDRYISLLEKLPNVEYEI